MMHASYEHIKYKYFHKIYYIIYIKTQRYADFNKRIIFLFNSKLYPIFQFYAWDNGNENFYLIRY